ncbi:WD40 repeat-like protein [Hymenopellis radicata]|nr:WD40 repeat-like protein [Hymenopellis radicata]
MSHLLTGADDGYIRNYDIFPAVNGKNFLTAPQRHHAGVVEGILKSGQLRFWWENPTPPNPSGSSVDEESSLSSVTSLAIHSDALWALAGSENGAINLFTVRHDPGTLCYTMQGHRRPVSALALDHDEKSFFSAGWDGDAIHWDLNTGQRTRTFTAHGAQLTAIAVRPMNVVHPTTSSSNLVKSDPLQSSVGVNENPATDKAPPQSSAPDGEGGSDDGSFDDLFDEPEGPPSNTAKASSSFVTGPPVATAPQIQQQQRPNIGGIAPPKNAPPVLTSDYYSIFSPDTLMTAAIDGQIVLWDKRVNTPGAGVGRLWMNEKTPPWCLSACWSPDGGRIYAGRRNGTIDVWDVRQLGRSAPSNTPRLLKTLRNPASSGVVSCVVAFPDNKHIACASIDNLRLWNVDAVDSDSSKPKSGVQFKIIPGHHGGYISNLLVDPGCRFLVSASSNRGWHGESTRTVFVHDIKHVP